MRDHDVFLERALLEADVVTAEQLEHARRHGAEHEVDVFDALVRMEVITSRAIALVKADVCEVPFVELTDFEACFANTRLVPRSVADRYEVFPLFLIDGVLTLAMEDPLNLEAADQVRQIARCDVDPVLCDREQLRALVARAYSLTSGRDEDYLADQTVVEEVGADVSQPVVAAVNQILNDAVDQRSSDIHINPDEHELHLRYRIDGVLHPRQGPPLSMHSRLVQRLKVMANLDLTQTRRPQDGKFRLRRTGTEIDVRMSTVPTVCGENVVLRLLASAQTFHGFHELGVPAPVASEFEELLRQPYGMLLVTGPTGSGKTTTLYTALSKINEPCRNIMTIEDPVEIRLPYVRQIQVHQEIGLTFATALRSILRQDPDVVLVGEIRDNETATIALQAALTGHLVLSTLHTNDAVGAVSRLRDYGLPPFVINSSVLGVMAQRLVRRVCQFCTRQEVPDQLMQQRFGLEAEAEGFTTGRGCGRCGQTGYRGRIGIYELLRLTPAIKALVEQGAPGDEIRARALRDNMQLMWKDGLAKARLGHTTLDEVAKAASVIAIADDDDDDVEERRVSMSQLTFHYKAYSREGALKRGEVRASDRHDAYRQIVASGMRPVKIRGRRLGAGRRRPIGVKDMSHLTRQFAVLMEACIPIVDGLRAIAEQEPNPHVSRVIEEIAAQIEGGSNITEAMSPHRDLFGDVYIESIKAAETSGNMVAVLSNLADILDRQYETTRNVRGALLYPFCVVAALVLALAFLMVFVVPRFAGMFESRGVPLPLPTQLVVAVSGFLRDYWYLVGAGLFGGVWGLRRAWQNPSSRCRIDGWLHRIPMIRTMLIGLAVSRFAHILGVTLRSGLSLIDALEMSGNASVRPLLQAETDAMCDQVRHGGRLSDVLVDCTYLPPFARRMLMTGEEAADLSKLCDVVARHYDREVGYLTKTVTTALEPILIVGLAMVVLVIALAIFLPMWNMAVLLG